MLPNSTTHRRAFLEWNYLGQNISRAEVRQRALPFPVACPSPARPSTGRGGGGFVKHQKLHLAPHQLGTIWPQKCPTQANKPQKKRKKKKSQIWNGAPGFSVAAE